MLLQLLQTCMLVRDVQQQQQDRLEMHAPRASEPCHPVLAQTVCIHAPPDAMRLCWLRFS